MFLSFVCTLLHAGSFVLQISEHQVCSLDKVPQACEWLLACLQVTLTALPAPPINSQARCSWFPLNQMEPELFSFIFFTECDCSRSHFKSWVIRRALAVLDLLYVWSIRIMLCVWNTPVPNHPPTPRSFFPSCLCHVCGHLELLPPLQSAFAEVLIWRPFLRRCLNTRAQRVPVAVQIRVPSPGCHMGRQMASKQAVSRVSGRITPNQY